MCIPDSFVGQNPWQMRFLQEIGTSEHYLPALQYTKYFFRWRGENITYLPCLGYILRLAFSDMITKVIKGKFM